MTDATNHAVTDAGTGAATADDRPRHDGVFITCAVTGSGYTAHKSDKVPVTPAEIADSCIEAARAGAAVVHIHVRDPGTGLPARDVDLYAEVADRVRSSDTDVVLNLTAGMGGDLVLGSVERPLPPSGDGTDMAGATERVAHLAKVKPEICTLDCGSMNFGEGDYVMTNTPAMLEAMAGLMAELGVRIEIEAFDTGHLAHARHLVARGIIPEPVLVQLCMGVPWGAPDDLNTFMAMRNNVPDGWTFSAFALGRNQLPYVSLAAMAGGNVRVGLEDNLYLDRGVLASNGDLVERAVTILEAQNRTVLTPAQVRDNLQLTVHG
ncbi:MAG: 3-keto-5-aminohexanoate cleavage protein [Actinomycetota bacterium]